jgi:hypothetical protein
MAIYFIYASRKDIFYIPERKGKLPKSSKNEYFSRFFRKGYKFE